MLSHVTATATNKGDIAVIITDADGKRVQAEISIELAVKLKAQIKSGASYSPHSSKPTIAPGSCQGYQKAQERIALTAAVLGGGWHGPEI